MAVVHGKWIRWVIFTTHANIRRGSDVESDSHWGKSIELNRFSVHLPIRYLSSSCAASPDPWHWSHGISLDVMWAPFAPINRSQSEKYVSGASNSFAFSHGRLNYGDRRGAKRSPIAWDERRTGIVINLSCDILKGEFMSQFVLKHPQGSMEIRVAASADWEGLNSGIVRPTIWTCHNSLTLTWHDLI